MDRKTMNTLNGSMHYRPRLRRHSGFTLIELIVAMVIAAILAAIAIPSYSTYILKSHRTEAKTALLDIASLEERFFSANNAYTKTPSDLGYTGPVDTAFTVGSGYYNVLVDKTDATAPTTAAPAGIPATYILTATAISPQQQKDTSCLTFTLDSKGNQGPTSAANCWK
jgi:type IV pilus assembly protein PilE